MARPDADRLATALEPLYSSDEVRSNVVRWLCRVDPTTRAAIVAALVGEPSRNGAGTGDDTGPTAEAFPLLRELIETPELLRPPEELLPRLVWRGRTTLLAGPDKSGKSTLAARGVAALTTGGSWLGVRLQAGSAVVVAPDEAVGDTVRRLHEAGADPDRVRVLTLRPPDLLSELAAVLECHPADVVVVDSLAEWARLTVGQAPDDGDSSGWGGVVRPLVQLSRDHDCGFLLLHHPRRSDGQYRGSGEIAAAVDALIEMTMPTPSEDPTLRRFRGRARWPMEDWAIRMDEGAYLLGGGGPVPLETRIVMDTAAHPGTSRNAQHGRLGGRKSTCLAAVNRLVESEGLKERDGGLYLPAYVEEGVL